MTSLKVSDTTPPSDDPSNPWHSADDTPAAPDLYETFRREFDTMSRRVLYWDGYVWEFVEGHAPADWLAGPCVMLACDGDVWREYLTDWYPVTTPPLRAGWYDVWYDGDTEPQPWRRKYWHGHRWQLSDIDPELRAAFGDLPGDKWRGRAAE